MKYITCENCGQIGWPLQKTDDDLYICLSSGVCSSRNLMARLSKSKKLCSHCIEAATYECSCGLLLCTKHQRGRAHEGHFATSLPRQHRAKSKLEQ